MNAGQHRILAGVAVLLVLGLTALLLITRSDLQEARARVALLESAERQRQSEAAARPDIEAAVRANGLQVVIDSADRTAASLAFTPNQIVSYQEELEGLLRDLGFNAPAVRARLGNTRAVDGTQSEETATVKATWTYHPDDGLNMVIEHKR